MELKVVRYKTSDKVAIITLNRPDRLNSWTGRMHTEYRWALAQADGDRSVRVIVVTGAGRAFCAGADSRALSGHVERGGYDPGTPDELSRPGYGIDPRFDADFAITSVLRSRSSLRSTDLLPGLVSCWPAFAISALQRQALS